MPPEGGLAAHQGHRRDEAVARHRARDGVVHAPHPRRRQGLPPRGAGVPAERVLHTGVRRAIRQDRGHRDGRRHERLQANVSPPARRTAVAGGLAHTDDIPVVLSLSASRSK